MFPDKVGQKGINVLKPDKDNGFLKIRVVVFILFDYFNAVFQMLSLIDKRSALRSH